MGGVHSKEWYELNRNKIIKRNVARRARYPELVVWEQMRQRCLNPKAKSYRYYGARGIKVAPQWKVFKQFRADVGPRPSRAHQLHRLGDTGNYEPGNVVWSVDHSEGF